jgi:uncharacterized SAM-binding protein YcdF (DUF218 family)
MSVLQHLVSELTKPLMAALLLALVAAVVRLRSQPRIALALLLGAVAIVYLPALPPVADALLRPLERQYHPLADDPLPSVHYVVVLGGGFAPRSDASITGELDDDGLERIVEGIRLLRHMPGAQLVVSGGALPPYGASAIGYARLARDFGVEDAGIIMLSEAKDTAAEARAIAGRLGAAPFVLVTSAYHMPRAMRLMQRAGARPLAAPVGQRCGKWPGSVLPRAAALGSTERAVHEYLGLSAIALGLD